jgi:hypothetical protein
VCQLGPGRGSLERGLRPVRREHRDRFPGAVVLQGQPAPGTLGEFSTFREFINGWPSDNLGLGSSGDVLVSTTFEVDGVSNLGFWRFGTDSKLERLFARGGLAPQSGGGTFTNAPQGGAVNDAGRFLFSVGVFGGKFTEAIYITK